MEKMSFISILTVVLPEIVLGSGFSLLVIGEKRRLILDSKEKIIRAIIFVFLMCLTPVVTRRILPSKEFVLIANFLMYIIITKFSLNIKLLKALIQTLIFVGSIIMIENLFYPVFQAFIDNNLESTLYTNDIIKFIFTIPQKVIHLIGIIILWNMNIVLINLKKYKEIAFNSTMTIVPVLISIVCMSYILVNSVHMSMVLKILLAVCIFLLILSAIFFTKLITSWCKTVRFEVVKNVREENKIVDYIYYLAQKGDIRRIINICTEKKKEYNRDEIERKKKLGG